MLQSSKHVLNYSFSKEKLIRTLFINSLCNDKKNSNSEVQKYMSEIKKNFQNFSNMGVSEVNKPRKSVSYGKSFNHKKTKMFNKNKNMNVAFSKINFTGNLKCILERKDQVKIDNLMAQRLDHESKVAVLDAINNSKIPSFESLRRLCSWLSKEGDPHTIKVIQNTIKYNYKYIADKENNFDHYLSEALFKSGSHDEALKCLAALVEQCNNLKRVKETSCFLIRAMVNVSEDTQRKIYDICEKFISLHNESKPANVFLEIAALSKQNHLYKLADLLLENHSEILLKDLGVVTTVVNKAQLQNDHEVLQKLIEILLKYENIEALSLVLSTLLEMFCFSGDLSKANEIVMYSKETDIYLSAKSIQHFFHLLHKNEKEAPWSALMIKHKFKKLYYKDD